MRRSAYPMTAGTVHRWLPIQYDANERMLVDGIDNSAPVKVFASYQRKTANTLTPNPTTNLY